MGNQYQHQEPQTQRKLRYKTTARKSAAGWVPASRQLATEDNRKDLGDDTDDLGEDLDELFGASDEEAASPTIQNHIIAAIQDGNGAAAAVPAIQNGNGAASAVTADLQQDIVDLQQEIVELNNQLRRVTTELAETRASRATAVQESQKTAAAAALASAAAVESAAAVGAKVEALQINLAGARESLDTANQTIRDEHARCTKLEKDLASATGSWQDETQLQLETLELCEKAKGTRASIENSLYERIFDVPSRGSLSKRRKPSAGGWGR